MTLLHLDCQAPRAPRQLKNANTNRCIGLRRRPYGMYCRTNITGGVCRSCDVRRFVCCGNLECANATGRFRREAHLHRVAERGAVWCRNRAFWNPQPCFGAAQLCSRILRECEIWFGAGSTSIWTRSWARSFIRTARQKQWEGRAEYRI